MKLPLAIVCGLALAGCQRKAADDGLPPTFATLVTTMKAPGLAGPLAPYAWTMALAEARAKGREQDVLDAGDLRYALVGEGAPPRLAQILIRSTRAEDPRPILEAAWGPPQAIVHGTAHWWSDTTRAATGRGELSLVGYRPLRSWLGDGDRLGFEDTRPLTDIPREELTSRLGPTAGPVQLGYDELAPIRLAVTFGGDGRVETIAFEVLVPADQVATRGQAVLERFGRPALDPGETWAPFGAREVHIVARGDQWTVTVRRSS